MCVCVHMCDLTYSLWRSLFLKARFIPLYFTELWLVGPCLIQRQLESENQWNSFFRNWFPNENSYYRRTVLQSWDTTAQERQDALSSVETDKPFKKCMCLTMNLWASYLWQRQQEHTREKKQSLQRVVLGKLDSYVLKIEIRMLPNTIHTKNSKWIKDPM